MGPSLDLAFDRNNRQRTHGLIPLMAARRHDRSDDERNRRNVRAENIRPMNRRSQSWRVIFAGAGLSLLALGGRAAADAGLPVKAAPSSLI